MITLDKHPDSLEPTSRFPYFVYEHLADGKVFYVGKGKGKRAEQSRSRSKQWKEIARGANKIQYKIVRVEEEEDSANFYEREQYLIRLKEGHTLTNKKIPDTNYKRHQAQERMWEQLTNNNLPPIQSRFIAMKMVERNITSLKEISKIGNRTYSLKTNTRETYHVELHPIDIPSANIRHFV